MATVSSLHKIVKNPDCTSEEIQVLLDQDSSSINELDARGIRPLHRLLHNPKCSADVVKVMLDYGAEIELEDVCGFTPLYKAIMSDINTDVIQLLLNRGANVNNSTKRKISPLFLALYYHVNVNTIEVLLKAGANVNNGDLTSNESCLCVALENNVEIDIIKVILKRGVDVNKVGKCDRSPLCIALQCSNNNLDLIKVLLDAGAFMNGCKKHVTALHCYVYSNDLKADVLEFLLKGVDVNTPCFGYTVLHRALLSCTYDTNTIKLLLFHKNDTNVRNRDGSYLHAAVQNEHCKLSVVTILINLGARVDAVDEFGDMPLHQALRCLKCHPGIIKVLLKNGSPVNFVNRYGETPLGIAMKRNCNLEIIKILLAFGAQIKLANKCLEFSILNQAVRKYRYRKNSENLERLQMFLKYTFHESPNFNIKSLIWRHQDYRTFLHFSRLCFEELKFMESKAIGHKLTLRDFVNEYSGFQTHTSDCNQEVQDFEFSRLLRILANNEFPIYFELISAKIKRSLLRSELEKQLVYTEMSCLDSPCIKRKVILNHASVDIIVQFLSDIDLLSLNLAFHNTENQTVFNHSKEIILLPKRSLEQSTLCVKRSRHFK